MQNYKTLVITVHYCADRLSCMKIRFIVIIVINCCISYIIYYIQSCRVALECLNTGTNPGPRVNRAVGSSFCTEVVLLIIMIMMIIIIIINQKIVFSFTRMKCIYCQT